MRVHAVTPKLVICVMDLTSIWRILLMTDGLNAVWSNDRAAPTDTNPKNLELAPPQSVTATRLDQLVYSPNYYIQIFPTQPFARSEDWTLNLHARSYQVQRAYQLRYGSKSCSTRWNYTLQIVFNTVKLYSTNHVQHGETILYKSCSTR